MEENIKSEEEKKVCKSKEEKKVCKWSISIWKCAQQSHWRNANQNTKRYYFISITIAIFKKTDNIKCRWGYGTKWNPLPPHCQWECKMVPLLWRSQAVSMENNLAVPQKVKYKVAIWPSRSAPRYLSKRNENVCAIKFFTQIFIVALFIIVKRGQLKGPPTSEWLNKIWNSHSVKYYLAVKIYFILKNCFVKDIVRSMKREITD